MTPRSHSQAARLRGLYVILDPDALPPHRVGAPLGAGSGGGGEVRPGGAGEEAGDRLLHIAREALAGGARLVQYRAKTQDKGDQYAIAAALQSLCRENGALFFMNDHADIALAIEADGVHVGQRDLPVAVVRKIVPDDDARGRIDEQRRRGAAGRGRRRGLRLGRPPLPHRLQGRHSPARRWRCCKQSSQRSRVPVCGIGGINESNIGSVIDAGADMAAVISAVVAADDVRERT